MERQQLDILSKQYVRLSINTGMTRHVQTLSFILIGEGSHVADYFVLFQSIKLDCCTANEYKTPFLQL
jgi:hypothetical protein